MHPLIAFRTCPITVARLLSLIAAMNISLAEAVFSSHSRSSAVLQSVCCNGVSASPIEEGSYLGERGREATLALTLPLVWE